MFNIGFSELIIILLVALIVVGPSDLPKVARAVAKLYKKAMRLWKEILAAINFEDEVDDIKNTKKEMEKVIKEADPLSMVKKEVDDAKKSIQVTKKEVEEQFVKKNV